MMANGELNPNLPLNSASCSSSDPGLQHFFDRLKTNKKRDIIVQGTLDQLQKTLQVNRVVIYFFYEQWRGQVTFEALSHPKWSIYGSTGADECFNDQYAALYLAGRTRAITDIEVEPIHSCHRDFLRSIEVRANLVVPVLFKQQYLWGLMVAHHCENRRSWLSSEIELLQAAAENLVTQLTELASKQ